MYNVYAIKKKIKFIHTNIYAFISYSSVLDLKLPKIN